MLLAIIASMYAVYHGPAGLKAIATQIHQATNRLAATLTEAGFTLGDQPVFDTLRVTVGDQQAKILERAAEQHINLRIIDSQTLGLSLDETTTEADLADLLGIFTGSPTPPPLHPSTPPLIYSLSNWRSRPHPSRRYSRISGSSGQSGKNSRLPD